MHKNITPAQIALARVLAHACFDGLDVAVNTESYGLRSSLEEVSEAEVRAQLEINFFGALWVIQAALPFLREQRSGHIL